MAEEPSDISPRSRLVIFAHIGPPLVVSSPSPRKLLWEWESLSLTSLWFLPALTEDEDNSLFSFVRLPTSSTHFRTVLNIFRWISRLSSRTAG